METVRAYRVSAMVIGGLISATAVGVVASIGALQAADAAAKDYVGAVVDTKVQAPMARLGAQLDSLDWRLLESEATDYRNTLVRLRTARPGLDELRRNNPTVDMLTMQLLQLDQDIAATDAKSRRADCLIERRDKPWLTC